MTPTTTIVREPCRLCGGATDAQFSLLVLRKYNVSYLKCTACESLQAEAPYWLSETYGGSLPNMDQGAARRAMRTCSTVLLASKLLPIARGCSLLDFGGGDGLVCRLLRDLGFDAFVYDKYSKNFYADGFEGRCDKQYEIVCAVEVWEHLTHPASEIDLIFSKRPRLAVISTAIYEGQSSDWPYLSPGGGGHVFFYSRRAMAMLAARYGYDFFIRDSTTIFSRFKIPSWRRFALSLALSPVGLLIGRLWLQLIRPHRDPPDLIDRSPDQRVTSGTLEYERPPDKAQPTSVAGY